MFRGKAIRHELKFLHRVLRQVLQRTANHVVVVVHSVDRDVAAAPQPAGRRDDYRLRLRGIERRSRRVTGHQERQLEEVAAVQGKGSDLTRRDDGPDIGADDVHRACGSGDSDLFLETGDLQCDLQVQHAAHLDHQPLQLTRSEARGLDRELDLARDNIGDGETPNRVGQRFPREARLTLDHADVSRDALLLSVQHTTANRAGAGLLCCCRRGNQRPDRRENEQSATAHDLLRGRPDPDGSPRRTAGNHGPAHRIQQRVGQGWLLRV